VIFCDIKLYTHKLIDKSIISIKMGGIKMNSNEAVNEVCLFGFGWAILQMKDGKAVARSGWNGKGMFLYYVPASEYEPFTDVAKKAFPDGKVPYGAYIAMKTAQGNVVPWLASQTDMLSEDWVVVEKF